MAADYDPAMQLSTALEQHIAVFGESGSGKTVLLSCFYGATQEPQYSNQNAFRVVADDFSARSRLHQNYLGMKNSAKAPQPDRFEGASYAFSIKLKAGEGRKRPKVKPFDALKLVWHDYPGEWFEQEVSGPAEAQQRVDTFRSLLGSDVALLLVDGQRLLDNAGEEERYLKSLLANFGNGLLSLKNDLLPDGERLVDFPRIWILALSKSDLMPELDVYGFRDLLIEKARDEIVELRNVIAEFVQGGEALSVGEDFMLLSSATFSVNKIEVAKRVGVELILPLAAVLPFERHLRWAQAKQLPGKVAENLMRGLGPIAAALIGSKGKFGILAQRLHLNPAALVVAGQLVGDRLKEVNAQAMVQEDHLTATLTRFKMDLDKGEHDRTLLRSLQ